MLPSGVAAGCGSAHFPPNALKAEYDYQQMAKQVSVCDNWLKYLTLSGAAKSVNASTWCNPQTEDIDVCEAKFLRWWYTHLPKAEGCNADERLNNWWRYIVEPERYKAYPVPSCKKQ